MYLFFYKTPKVQKEPKLGLDAFFVGNGVRLNI